MAAIITDISSFFTAALGWMGDVMTEVSTNPILFIMVAAMPIAGYGVGLLKRLLRL